MKTYTSKTKYFILNNGESIPLDDELLLLDAYADRKITKEQMINELGFTEKDLSYGKTVTCIEDDEGGYICLTDE